MEWSHAIEIAFILVEGWISNLLKIYNFLVHVSTCNYINPIYYILITLENYKFSRSKNICT